MSNETKTDNKQAQSIASLTRYPVRQVWFDENLDTLGAQQVSNLKGWKQGDVARYHEIDWVPAWQAFHIRYFESGKFNSEQWITARSVRRFTLMG